jgi:DNA end-binding protein Ku
MGASRIDPLTFDQPYYIIPDEGGARSFAVFRNALAASDRVGLGRLRLRTREHLAAVVPIPHGLAAVLLRPFEEVAAPPAVGSLSAGTGEIKMARLLIDQMSEEALDPAKYPDRYRSALKKLLAKKGASVSARSAAAGQPEAEGRVIDLMDALRASVARRGGKSPRKRRVA